MLLSHCALFVQGEESYLHLTLSSQLCDTDGRNRMELLKGPCIKPCFPENVHTLETAEGCD